MSITHKLILEIVKKLISAVLPIMSEEIRKLLISTMNELYVKAKETENPWDDFVVKLICDILDIPVKD
ncbi:MAG: hypothetical protein QXG39_06045 [Candidatus Aenigmatarchaeota archaeon]